MTWRSGKKFGDPGTEHWILIPI